MNRKRRGRGEGGVFLRSDGQWVASASLGYTADGKRSRLVAYGPTKAKAMDALKQKQTKLGRGIRADRNLTVESYLADWLRIVKPTVGETTFAEYERHIDKHLVPKIGTMKLDTLAESHVQRLYAALLDDGTSPAMVRKVGTTLGSALENAVRTKLIAGNPTKLIAKPKATKPAPVVFDVVQVNQFLKAAESDRLAALYFLAVDSGCRQGELFALRWSDLDLTTGTMTVSKSLSELASKLSIKEPKTTSGRRRVMLSFSLPALIAHKQRMLAEKQNVTDGIVFCNTRGSYLRKPTFFRQSFERILKRAGVPKCRFHDLRHASATLLLSAGVNMRVVSERLGHASTAFTLATYLHSLPGQQETAAQKLGALLASVPANGSAPKAKNKPQLESIGYKSATN